MPLVLRVMVRLCPRLSYKMPGQRLKTASYLLTIAHLNGLDTIAHECCSGYDGMHLLAHAIRQSKSLEGDAIRSALENLHFRYQGVVTSYEKPFSSRDHDAITTNMIVMGKYSMAGLIMPMPKINNVAPY